MDKIIHLERRTNTLLIHTRDQIAGTAVQIEKSLLDVQKVAMLDPKEWDTYGIGLQTLDMLGLVNPSHLGPMFACMELQ